MGSNSSIYLIIFGSIICFENTKSLFFIVFYCISQEKDEFYKQPMYYAMGHFSKFVPAGSVAVPSWIQQEVRSRTQSNEEAIEKDLHVTAFIHPNCHLVVVILNM